MANKEDIVLSVLMPCLNEEEAVGESIIKVREAIQKLKVNAEILVIDNGSTDNSVETAKNLGARVVFEPQKGYGNAYRKGFKEARGKYIVMADADASYDVGKIAEFLQPMMNKEADFVMGSRFKGKIYPGAMPWANRYIGNPILTGILKYLFGVKISDAHCGMRAITKEAYQRLHIITTGMEFASEMIVSALSHKLKLLEIPVDYYPRKGKSKLVPFKDAWRHIRFMLLFSPTYLFLAPGLLLFLSGMIILTVMMLFGTLEIAGRVWDIHFMFVSSLLAILGLQIVNLGFYARTYSLNHGFTQEDKTMSRFWKYFNLERGLFLGAVMFLVGCGFNLFILWKWVSVDFGPLYEIRRAIFALTVTVIGAQTIFSSFFLSIMGINIESDGKTE